MATLVVSHTWFFFPLCIWTRNKCHQWRFLQQLCCLALSVPGIKCIYCSDSDLGVNSQLKFLWFHARCVWKNQSSHWETNFSHSQLLFVLCRAQNAFSGTWSGIFFVTQRGSLSQCWKILFFHAEIGREYHESWCLGLCPDGIWIFPRMGTPITSLGISDWVFLISLNVFFW